MSEKYDPVKGLKKSWEKFDEGFKELKVWHKTFRPENKKERIFLDRGFGFIVAVIGSLNKFLKNNMGE